MGSLLLEAMRRKAEEVGGEYSYRDLDRDSQVHFTYAQKVVAGTRQPSRKVIEAWSRALRPYLPLHEALVAAGYLPGDGETASILADFARRSNSWLREARRYLDDVARGAVKDEPDDRRDAEDRSETGPGQE